MRRRRAVPISGAVESRAGLNQRIRSALAHISLAESARPDVRRRESPRDRRRASKTGFLWFAIASDHPRLACDNWNRRIERCALRLLVDRRTPLLRARLAT